MADVQDVTAYIDQVRSDADARGCMPEPRVAARPVRRPRRNTLP